jgi:hypothetical protein
MKHNKYPHDQKQQPSSIQPPTAAVEINQSGTGFTASAEEVAQRAYFAYLNEGSLPGRGVQHWLEAEAQLIAERNLSLTPRSHPAWQ